MNMLEIDLEKKYSEIDFFHNIMKEKIDFLFSQTLSKCPILQKTRTCPMSMNYL
jgi:hypothetical protein